MNLKELVQNILNLGEDINSDNIKKLQRAFAKANNLSKIPTNIQILRMYNEMISTGEITRSERFEVLLRKRAVRSLSGIVPIQVLTKPYPCPGKCIFCPNDDTMPKSYIKSEPGAMRAALNDFDPIKQVYNRLLSLKMTGHHTDKIEMIVLGGTFDFYPMDYKISFIKSLYDACNTFDQFIKYVKIDHDNPKSMKYTVYKDMDIENSSDIQTAQKINESAEHKIIGLTIETRPDFVTDENCRFWREIGVTRIEMGIQSLDDEVLKANRRGTSVEMIKKSIHKLRQYGFKFSFHFMPGLYKSSVESDIQTMKMAYTDPYIKPDEIKFYPTSVIPGTELEKLYNCGDYQPLTPDEIKHITKIVKTEILPPYSRIKRLVRDIPGDEILAGSMVTNLRQTLVHEILCEFRVSEKSRSQLYSRLYPHKIVFDTTDKFLSFLTSSAGDVADDDIQTFFIGKDFDETSFRDFVCLCTRCREIRDREVSGDINIIIRRYGSSVGDEYFISLEDTLGYLYGFVRLLLPLAGETISWDGLGHDISMVRELHVYGSLAKINEKSKEKFQHKGFGTLLMNLAEDISRIKGYNKLSVISGIGVKPYYEKLGYYRLGTYVTKDL